MCNTLLAKGPDNYVECETASSRSANYAGISSELNHVLRDCCVKREKLVLLKCHVLYTHFTHMPAA